MTMGIKQTQQGGDYSRLEQVETLNDHSLHVGNVVIQVGITEERARAICQETYSSIREMTDEALAVADGRVAQLENRLIPKMQQLDERLSAFGDPDFQLQLKSAQRTAAVTDRDADYDLLSELLLSRVTTQSGRKELTGISRAIQIVNEVDDDALCALTVFYAISRYSPVQPYYNEGISRLATMFDKLLYSPLPDGDDWLEHLDLLGAVRIGPIGKFKPFGEVVKIKMPGYINPGIPMDSEAHQKAIEILAAAGLNDDLMEKSPFCEGYIRVPTVNRESIRNLRVVHITDGGMETSVPFTETQISAFEAICDLYKSDEKTQKRSLDAFLREWDAHPSLQKAHTWWDSLPSSFSITAVGNALAYTNARRCDASLPEIRL